LLIDTLENLQISSSEQIKAMNKRINELENLLITFTTNQTNLDDKNKSKFLDKSIQIKNKDINKPNHSFNDYLKEESELKPSNIENLIDHDETPIQIEKDLNNKTWSEIELKLKVINISTRIMILIKLF
jgi:hypothetical protein